LFTPAHKTESGTGISSMSFNPRKFNFNFPSRPLKLNYKTESGTGINSMSFNPRKFNFNFPSFLKIKLLFLPVHDTESGAGTNSMDFNPKKF
jgi:hypothetical protein